MRKLQALLLLFFVTAAPLAAGTVYIPFVVDRDLDNGTLVQTEIHLTNNSRNQIRGFTYLVLPAGSDGTERGEDDGTDILLQPLSTFVLREVVAPGASAMVEIIADNEISVVGRLVSINPDGSRNLGAVIPPIDSNSVINAGVDGYLQGWRRIAGQMATDFAMVNLGTSETTCAAFIQTATGTPLTNGIEFTVPPLSQRNFPDVLSLLGLQAVEGISAYFNCNQPTFPFSATFDFDDGELLFFPPSASGRSTLQPPGMTDPPIPGAMLFELPGLFHRPTIGNEQKRFNIPMPGNPVFSRIVIDMDFVHGGWQQPSNNNHNIMWFNRGTVWRSNNFGYVNSFGPGSNFIKLTTNANLPAGVVQTKQQGAQLFEGNTYHLHFEYDTAIDRIIVQVSQNGNNLVNIVDVPTVNTIRTVDNNWFVSVGHGPDEEGPELPTYNWEYRDFRAQFVP